MGTKKIPFFDFSAVLDKLQAIADNVHPTASGTSITPTGMHIVTEDDVQGAISELDSAVDSVNSSLAHNLMTYEDVTITTGTSQYTGYFYGDGSITTSVADKEIVSVFVYSATSNRPAFLQRIGATSIRAYCPVAETTIVVRVLFKHN